jgi:hypothetical protein
MGHRSGLRSRPSPAPRSVAARRAVSNRAILAGLAIAVAALPAAAAGPAIGLRAGTTGLGPEISWALGSQATLRLGAAGLSYRTTYNDTGIDYDGDLSLRHGLLLLDWHPGGSVFRVTAGAAANDNRLDVTAPLVELLRRHRPDLPPVGIDLGMLRGSATTEPWGPYLGIGFGNPARASRWSVSLDLGAVYHGRPAVRLDTDPALPVDLIPGGREELERMRAAEERALEEELSSYRYLPVVSLGVAYSF